VFCLGGFDVERGYEIEPFHVRESDHSVRTKCYKLIGILYNLYTKKRRATSNHSMNQLRNIRVPDTNLMIETSREQQNQILVKRQGQYPPSMHFIDPLGRIINRIPQNKFPVHATTRHKLQLRHRKDIHDHQLMAHSRLRLHKFFRVHLEIPFGDGPVFMPAIENLIVGVPAHRVDLAIELVLDMLLVVFGLGCEHEPGVG
jgi:hypothetical protein